MVIVCVGGIRVGYCLCQCSQGEWGDFCLCNYSQDVELDFCLSKSNSLWVSYYLPMLTLALVKNKPFPFKIKTLFVFNYSYLKSSCSICVLSRQTIIPWQAPVGSQ